MKRIFSIVLTLAMLMSVCVVGASAAGVPFNANEEGTPMASFYLTVHSADATTGSSRGAMLINYRVSSSVTATSIGVEEIVIYRSNGSQVATIGGSTGNGLICLGSSSHRGSYTYTGVAGESYYAKVTVFAKSASGSDSYTVTTGTVTVR